jgi:uracil-DNA glycosylase family 4
MTLTELNKRIRKCRKCRLWKDAKNAVPGEGPLNAKVMLVGQNPGAEEDKTGRPFVGRAGKFLNKVLAENGFNREELFITNLVKHTSPKNRKPLPDEIAACAPYLEEQVKAIKPKLVVLMGTVAWQAPRVEGVEYVKTVHPSAAMRFTKMRKRFEEDFSALKKLL